MHKVYIHDGIDMLVDWGKVLVYGRVDLVYNRNNIVIDIHDSLFYKDVKAIYVIKHLMDSAESSEEREDYYAWLQYYYYRFNFSVFDLLNYFANMLERETNYYVNPRDVMAIRRTISNYNRTIFKTCIDALLGTLQTALNLPSPRFNSLHCFEGLNELISEFEIKNCEFDTTNAQSIDSQHTSFIRLNGDNLEFHNVDTDWTASANIFAPILCANYTIDYYRLKPIKCLSIERNLNNVNYLYLLILLRNLGVQR